MNTISEKSATLAAPGSQVRRVVFDIGQLIKARLTLLVLVTTLVGFLLAWQGEMDWLYLFHTLFGTGLAAAGIVYLSLATNLIAGILTAITVGSYLFAYTPLKRVTTLNTVVGAIPGALPPVIGWTAARGEASFESWVLFAILFLWQMPHFLAIAWLYREDYKQAGFVMLCGDDPDCVVTGRQALLYTMGLVTVSLFPITLRITSVWFLPFALLTGTYLFLAALRFARSGSEAAARGLFVASIVYLPVTLGALVVTRF